MNFEEFKGMRTMEALQAGLEVKEVVIAYDGFTHALARCLDLIATLSTLKMPGGVLIQADPGMGKSLLLDLIQRSLKASAEAGQTVPCLRLTLDSGVDTRKLAAMTMQALGYPALPSTPKLERLNDLVDTGLARTRPMAFVADEFQHVCHGNRDITAGALMDWLKIRLDKTNIPFVGAGTMALDRLEHINRQFTSRVSARVMLRPIEYGDTWRKLLAAYAQQVKRVDMEVLNGAVSRPLHDATKGNMRALKKILVFGAMYAANREPGRLSPEDLTRGYDDIMTHPTGLNPLRGR